MRNLAAAFCGVAALVVAAAPTAYADSHRVWDDSTIGDIIDDVEEIKEQITNKDEPIRSVANDFKGQLDELVAKGAILRESVTDILTWLKLRERPYREFIYGNGSIKCGPNTDCDIFGADLENFFADFGALRENFPIFEKVGMGDGSRAIKAVREAPAILLFALDRTMRHVPDWQSMPQELQGLFDEIGDREVFELGSFLPGSSGSVSVQASSLQTNAAAVPGLLPETPTQRFCRKRARAIERENDSVRMNRIKLIVSNVRLGLSMAQALTSETLGAEVLGEGNETLLPNPLKMYVEMVVISFDGIRGAVETFRANVEVCRNKNREIEMQVAQCIPLVNAVMPGSRDDIYNLVQTKIDSAEEDGLDVSLSNFWLSTADMQRTAGEYREAFGSLCSAYGTIGSACNGGCQPNSGGGGRKNP